MLEEQYAQELLKEYNKMIKDKLCAINKYYEDEPKYKNCNFSILQEQCNKLGFIVEELNKTKIEPIRNKKIWQYAKGFILYSPYSLTITCSYKDR